ncbi:hypothetical protein EVAR_89717_1 [Eumeta japonica]|uniref:Uncharacterized protein n=1 Tax=Eumeta variegata TaxID=151549 RepID=A0A4C1Y4X0_EUMVA|nr:hypothetical protein EVAR_89717_1 [Eumeta japonica]
MSSSGLECHEAPPGGTSFSHWYNQCSALTSPVPIFVTVSLTADSSGARPRGSRRVAACARMEQRMVAAVTLCAAFARQYARGCVFCYALETEFSLQSPISHHSFSAKGVTRGELYARRALRTLCCHFGLRVHFEGFTPPRCAIISWCLLRLTERRRPGVDLWLTWLSRKSASTISLAS